MKTSLTRDNDPQCMEAMNKVYRYVEACFDKKEDICKYDIKKIFNATELDDFSFLYLISDAPVGKIQYGQRTVLC
jgi:hypothetical protein